MYLISIIVQLLLICVYKQLVSVFYFNLMNSYSDISIITHG